MKAGVFALLLLAACAAPEADFEPLAPGPRRAEQPPTQYAEGGLPAPVEAGPPSGPLRLGSYDLTAREAERLDELVTEIVSHWPDAKLHALDVSLSLWWGLRHGALDLPADLTLNRCVVPPSLGESRDLTTLARCETSGAAWLVGPLAFNLVGSSETWLREHAAAVRGNGEALVHRLLLAEGHDESSWIYAHVTESSLASARYLVRDATVAAALFGPRLRGCVDDHPSYVGCKVAGDDARELGLALTPSVVKQVVTSLQERVMNAKPAVVDEPSVTPSEPSGSLCEGRDDGTYCGWALHADATRLYGCGNGAVQLTFVCGADMSATLSAAGLPACAR